MTKHRAPLSIDAALARIAGHLPGGWSEMAGVAGRCERTVRGWGDADREEQIPISAAIALDLAFQAAGGQGAPIFEAYALKVEAAGVTRFADRHALASQTINVLRETGEAHIALLLASQPGADSAQFRRTVRETEEAIAEMRTAILMLQAPTQSQPP